MFWNGMFDLITVGHFAIDLILSQETPTATAVLGGPPTYVSLAARQLNSRVSVISKVGEDFPSKYLLWLKTEKVDLSGLKIVKGASTTSFFLKYENEKRRLQLKSRAPSIFPEDIPISIRSEAIHVAPIANELSLDVIKKLRALTKILSLDPQGLLRRFDKFGNVELKKGGDSEVLERIDIYKSSLREIKILTGLVDLQSAMKEIHSIGPKIVLVTKGIMGATLFFEERFHDIPSCKPRITRDSTGAGDAFIGAFLAEYIKRKDPLWCACVGSAASSFVVEGIGPAVFGGKEETYRRANGIYEKGI
ncbi:MAG: PfkB family carbohydrate kinase [Candidatus Bathyarchaeota archaeon]|nr:PfkB family carbohydrate kinase [Candidatus Bathyarchaeota archaeon]